MIILLILKFYYQQLAKLIAESRENKLLSFFCDHNFKKAASDSSANIKYKYLFCFILHNSGNTSYILQYQYCGYTQKTWNKCIKFQWHWIYENFSECLLNMTA